MKPRTRRFFDAHPSARCAGSVTLKDGSKAQCGRSTRSGHIRCWQHEQKAAEAVRDAYAASEAPSLALVTAYVNTKRLESAP